MKCLNLGRNWGLALSVVFLAGVCQAGFVDGSFQDEKRKRAVPYRVYAADELKGRSPVLIFSHGLGGSIKGSGYLGEYLSEKGYVVIYIQHEGSDASVWEGKKGESEIRRALSASLRKPGNAVNRFKDVPFVLDEIEKLNTREGRLKGRLDLDHIGIMGHSYGAKSVLVAAGERMSRLYLGYKDKRIKAGLALSPNLPGGRVNVDKALAKVDIPLLHITGTEDRSPIDPDMSPSQRRVPYLKIKGADQYLLVLEGADHMTFSGSRLGKRIEKEKDEAHIAAVQRGALLFFDAYLKGDEEALKGLRKGYEKSLSEGDVFEWKEGS